MAAKLLFWVETNIKDVASCEKALYNVKRTRQALLSSCPRTRVCRIMLVKWRIMFSGVTRETKGIMPKLMLGGGIMLKL